MATDCVDFSTPPACAPVATVARAAAVVSMRFIVLIPDREISLPQRLSSGKKPVN
jgi:hypothetical protein